MYRRISVDVSEVDPKVTTRPAACQVVPDVRRSRSSTTTSVHPSLREVVGDATPDDAAPDDDDLGARRESAGRTGFGGEWAAHGWLAAMLALVRSHGEPDPR